MRIEFKHVKYTLRSKRVQKSIVLLLFSFDTCLTCIRVKKTGQEMRLRKCLICKRIFYSVFCLHHLVRRSTPAYASTDVPAHLISVLPVRSERSKENS